MEVFTLPKQVAIIKIKAHSSATSSEHQGNCLADNAAKRACLLLIKYILSPCEQPVVKKLADLLALYQQAPGLEVWTWVERGASLRDGVWVKGGKYVAPAALLPYLVATIHSLGHPGVTQMVHRFNQVWWNPKLRKYVESHCLACTTCLKANLGLAVSLSYQTVTPPSGPFQELKVDYITLPRCQGKQDCLIIICKFSRWIEGYATTKGTALHTAKCLVKDFIPRWGLPRVIESDQGTHFTGKVCQEVARLLEIKWHLHCPYRPQASGQVERMNRTLKSRLTKLYHEGVSWVEALPAVLCSIRASTNRSTQLSPYEIITGRPMSLPGTIDLRAADIHVMSDSLLKYCQTLSEAVAAAQNQVLDAWKEPTKGGHPFVAGMWVMVKVHNTQPLGPKWEGPYQVLLITPSAIKCQGKPKWIHVSHTKVVPPPDGDG